MNTQICTAHIPYRFEWLDRSNGSDSLSVNTSSTNMELLMSGNIQMLATLVPIMAARPLQHGAYTCARTHAYMTRARPIITYPVLQRRLALAMARLPPSLAQRALTIVNMFQLNVWLSWAFMFVLSYIGLLVFYEILSTGRARVCQPRETCLDKLDCNTLPSHLSRTIWQHVRFIAGQKVTLPDEDMDMRVRKAGR
jgi:hypothetical protein